MLPYRTRSTHLQHVLMGPEYKQRKDLEAGKKDAISSLGGQSSCSRPQTWMIYLSRTEHYISHSNTLLWRWWDTTTKPALRSTPTSAKTSSRCPSNTLKVRDLVTLRCQDGILNVLTRDVPVLLLFFFFFFFLQIIFLNENIFKLSLSLYFPILVLVSMPLTIFNCWWTTLHLENRC